MRTVAMGLVLSVSLAACLAQVDDGTSTQAEQQELIDYPEVPPIEEPQEIYPFEQLCISNSLCALVRVDFQGQRPGLDYIFRERDRPAITEAIQRLDSLVPARVNMQFVSDKAYNAQLAVTSNTEQKSPEQAERELDDLTLDWWKAVSSCSAGLAQCLQNTAPKGWLQTLLTVAVCTPAFVECVNAVNVANKIAAKQQEIEKAKQAEQGPGGEQPPTPVMGDPVGTQPGGGIGIGGGFDPECTSSWVCQSDAKKGEKCELLTSCD